MSALGGCLRGSCVICASLVLAGCAGTATEAKSKGKKGEGAVPVAVAAVSRRDVPLEVAVIGNVEAYSTVTVKPQVTGPVLKVHFREGEFVRRGDLLFTIDPTPFEAQLSEAEANLERNEAQLAQAQANLKRDVAQGKYMMSQAQRYNELFRQGIMSKEQTEQAQASAEATDGIGAGGRSGHQERAGFGGRDTLGGGHGQDPTGVHRDPRARGRTHRQPDH